MKYPAPNAHIASSRLRGFTLIELMIAITVAVFLIGGLLMMVQSTRNTFAAQGQLAQLQDNERLVLTFMTEVIEAAGYFPNPGANTSTAVMPIAAPFAAAGQAVFGNFNANPLVPDDVTIRYGAGPADDVFNCRGTKNAVAPYDTFVNRFWVKNPNTANPVLTCTFSSGASPAADVPLVNGVKNLKIIYGVKRNPVDTQSCADTYLNANQMTPADWSNVCTVKVTVSFINPLDPNKPVIDITRVIAVMNTAGVNS